MKQSEIAEHPFKSPNRLEVMFTPTWPKNPYHGYLISYLAKHDVDVVPDISMKELLKNSSQGLHLPSIIHLHTLSKFDNDPRMMIRLALLVIRIKKLQLRGVKIVMTVHDLLPHETIFPAADKLIGRIMGSLVDKLYVHSVSAKRKLINVWKMSGGSKINIIPHPNFIECYPNNIARGEARRRLNLAENEIVFLFLGQIRPYKGIDELLDGFSLTCDSKYKLLLAGEAWTSQLADRLSQRCQKDPRIALVAKFIPIPDVQIYMNACDVVMLPYRRAFTSGAALLAMSFAKPCIATNIDSFPDVMDVKGAFFCETADPESIAAAITAAAMSFPNLPEMGRHNFARASQWSWNDMALSLAAEYKSIIHSS